MGRDTGERCRNYRFKFFLVSGGGVGWDWAHLVRWPLLGLLYQPQTIDDDVWNSRWNENWQGKPSNGRIPVLAPLCPPEIPHGMIWAGSRAAAWAMARPRNYLTSCLVSASWNLRSSHETQRERSDAEIRGGGGEIAALRTHRESMLWVRNTPVTCDLSIVFVNIWREQMEDLVVNWL
jgi:hypothetical protein